MIQKISIAIIFFIVGVIFAPAIGSDPCVQIVDIPDSDNGDVIRGQSWIDDHGHIVAIFVDVAFVNDYYAIVCHEYGHANPNATEAECDQNAINNGYFCQDKYAGVH